MYDISFRRIDAKSKFIRVTPLHFRVTEETRKTYYYFPYKRWLQRGNLAPLWKSYGLKGVPSMIDQLCFRSGARVPRW